MYLGSDLEKKKKDDPDIFFVMTGASDSKQEIILSLEHELPM